MGEIMDETKNYMEILEQEDSALSNVIDFQKKLRSSVSEKNWTFLMKVVSDINLEMDKFNQLDEKRNQIVTANGKDFLSNSDVSALLLKVRGKLVRCRTENKALGDYINITRGFVKKVIDTSLPQSRAKLYGKTGVFVQNQPKSVVVDTVF